MVFLSLTMNYLAHAYLSFNQPHLLSGNMISDFIKGKKQFDFDPPIQQGIKLHRAIDHFTDTHPLVKEMKLPFKEKYGLYAGAFTDIVCDYFLANDTHEFSTHEQLAAFANETYGSLEDQLHLLPETFQRIFVYMKQYNWLYNYRQATSIQKSFAGIVNRAKYMNDSITAYHIFTENIGYFQPLYNEFFPLLKSHALLTIENLRKND